MKGLDDYKKLVPIFMGVLLVGSIYGRCNAAHKDSGTYEEYLESARAYRSEKIYATSKEEYEKALDMDESLDLYCEVEQMLEEEGNPTKIESWCEKMKKRYPNEPISYEYLINHYKETKEYTKCFREYEIVRGREISTDSIEDIIASIRYEYKLDSRGYTDVSDFIAGYATYVKEERHGLITEDGHSTFGDSYADISACDGSYTAVTDNKGESYYVDLNGDRRFNYPDGIKVTRIGKMFNDIIPVYTDDKVFYYTASDGIQILGPYDDGEAFSNSVAAVKEGDKWYIINTSGEKLTEGYDDFIKNSAGGVVSNLRVFAKKGEGYVLLDENLKQISKTVYEDAKPFIDDTYAAVKKDGKWGFIDNSGNFVIKPSFEDAYSFCHGLAPAFENGLWGYITTEGRWAVEPLFSKARPLNSKGCGFVMEQDKDKYSLIKFIEFNYQ